MPLFRRKRPYDRSTSLAAASQAQRKGRLRRAIRHYREVLEHDPEDLDVRAKIAPLLAETGDLEGSWRSFEAAARGHQEQGFHDRATGVYKSAARHLPRNVSVWRRLAELQVQMQRRGDAIVTLSEGSKHFRGGPLRGTAVELLRLAFEIEPWRFDVTLELGRALAAVGERSEAREILDGLAARSSGRQLRRVRAAQFRLGPTPLAAWKWLRAGSRR